MGCIRITFSIVYMALLSSTIGNAQSLLPDQPCAAQVMVSGELRSEGWGLGANRGLRFYRRGFLDSTFLAETRALMAPTTRFALESTERISGGWEASPSWRERNIHMGIDIRNTSATSGRFRRDLFELVFLGNQNFIGKTASGDDFYLRSISYRTWSVWAARSFSLKEHRIWLQLSLGWVQGLNYSNRTFPQLQFTTLDQAAALQLSISGDQQFLKERSKAFFGVNGSGFSFSGNLKWETPSNYKIVIQWEDMGWVNWKKLSSERWDTTAQFSGFALDASTLLNQRPQWNTDSIWQISKGEAVLNKAAALPFLWSISIDKPLTGSKWSLFAQARQRMHYQALPWFLAGAGYTLGSHKLETFLAGGGQGGYSLGAAWSRKKNQIDLRCTLQLPFNGLGPYAMSGFQLGASLLYRFGD